MFFSNRTAFIGYRLFHGITAVIQAHRDFKMMGTDLSTLETTELPFRKTSYGKFIGFQVERNRPPTSSIPVRAGLTTQFSLLKFLAQDLLGWLNFIRQRVLSQAGQNLKFRIQHLPHAVWNMLLMCAMDGYALLAVAMISAGFLAGAVVLFGIFPSELGDKFFLQSEPLLPVSLMEFPHRRDLFFIVFDLHPDILSGSDLKSCSSVSLPYSCSAGRTPSKRFVNFCKY